MKKTDYSEKKKAVWRGIMALVLLVIFALAVVCGINWFESQNSPEPVRGVVQSEEDISTRITLDGVTYRKRTDLTTILFLGIDRTEDSKPVGFRNGGQADFLLLAVIDDKNEKVTTIQIDRDTIAEITILGVLGNDAGTRSAQICLSHGFGDGGKQSSLLSAQAVSKLMLGVDIDFHIALNMDGISVLNDALGGIEVTLTDDFSALDPTMTPGTTLTLQGDQAEYYVRSRMNIGVGTNESRQVRQQVYMSKAKDVLLKKIHDNSNFVGTLFDTLSDYLETDMKRGRMINVAWKSRDYSQSPIQQLQGEHVVGETGFMEFHADPKSIEQLVLTIFYEQVDEQGSL